MLRENTITAPDSQYTTAQEVNFIHSFRKRQQFTQGIRYCRMILAELRHWDPEINKFKVLDAAAREVWFLQLHVKRDTSERTCAQVDIQISDLLRMRFWGNLAA